MAKTVPFGEILEAVDQLPPEDQETLLDVLQRRMIERRRDAIARDIRQAQREFQRGRCKPMTPSDLMKEITMSTEYPATLLCCNEQEF